MILNIGDYYKHIYTNPIKITVLKIIQKRIDDGENKYDVQVVYDEEWHGFIYEKGEIFENIRLGLSPSYEKISEDEAMAYEI